MRAMRAGTSRPGVLRDECAQATVEMAVVVPVLLVLTLITYNLMLFTAASARFDRVAPDVVLAHGVAPAEGEDGVPIDVAAVVENELARAMEGYDVEIEVRREVGAAQGDGSILSLTGVLCTYRCTMRLRPWPQGLSIAGVDLGAPAALAHERAITVDPWRSGVVV